MRTGEGEVHPEPHEDSLLSRVAHLVPAGEERRLILDAWKKDRFLLERRPPLSFEDPASRLLHSSDLGDDLRRIFGSPLGDVHGKYRDAQLFSFKASRGWLFLSCEKGSRGTAWAFCKKRNPEDQRILNAYIKQKKDAYSASLDEIACLILREGLALGDGVIARAFENDPHTKSSPLLNGFMAEIQAERLRGANPPAEKQIARPVI